MTIFWIIVAIISLPLAVWRTSSILIAEDGPYDLIAKFRALVGVRYDERSVAYGTNTLAILFTCIWCMSIWVSTVLSALLFYAPKFGAFVNLILAGSALAIMFEERLHGQSI